ncbi:tetratricopeptide repeat protein [Brevundimonas sp. VNH65]|uniref:tetratricopeptide repeat protein n=1 Tax=Brevundimonas sp. VNH65 TaxID=3400917 RepID=UPI003C08255F
MEHSTYPPHYPQDGTYADLLCWHMDYWGTRPTGSTLVNGEPWGKKELRQAAFGNSSASESTRVGLGHWQGLGSAPNQSNGARIQDALFGKNLDFQIWAHDLEHARKNCQGAGNNRRTVEFPDPPPVPPKFESIPNLAPRFMGRDGEVGALASALASAEGSIAILIQGGPGIGKTELTKAIARHAEVVERFGANRVFVRLEAAPTAVEMQEAVIRALGCDPQYGLRSALNTLRDKQTLLVLDNLETPWEPPSEREATKATLADLGAAGLSVLASFRGREVVGGLRWAHDPEIEPLSGALAAALFTDIAGQEVLGDPYLDRFVEALGGIPLAIDLVARQAHAVKDLVLLWTEWERIGDELAKDPDFGEDRLTSLPRSIALSLASVRMGEAGDASYRLFSLLGCLPAGLASSDCTALIGEDAFNARGRLLRVGLAIQRGDRIDLLPPIREHARRNRKPTGADRERWVEHFIAAIEGLSSGGIAPGDRNRIFEISLEFRNIEAAIFHKITTDKIFESPDILLEFLSLVNAIGGNTIVFITAADIFGDHGDVELRTFCLQAHGEISLYHLDYESAMRAYVEAINGYQQSGDRLGEANCLSGIGDVLACTNNLDSAISYYNDAIEVFRSESNLAGEAKCTCRLGYVEYLLGNLSAAERNYSLSLQILPGDPPSSISAANYIGIGKISLAILDSNRAKASFENALLLYKEEGFQKGIADALTGLGDVALACNSDAKSAYHIYKKAIPFHRRIGNIAGLAGCLQTFASAALRLGDPVAARAAYEEALQLIHEADLVHGEAGISYGIAEIDLFQGDYIAASRGFGESFEAYKRAGWDLGMANSLSSLAECAIASNDHISARDLYQRAATHYEKIGNVERESHCIGRMLYLE